MPAKLRAPKRCKKANVFPCKGECVRRYHWKSGKEQICRNVAVGVPATYLEWVKQQGQRKKIINTKRKAAGLPLLKSDVAGYLIAPGKDSKGKLPEYYKRVIEKAEEIGKKSKDPAIKQKAQDVVEKYEQRLDQLQKQIKKLEKENKMLKSRSLKQEKQKVEPIASYKDFKDTILSTFDRINHEDNYNNSIPIYVIRRAIGDRVTRSQFKDWMLKIRLDRLLSFYIADNRKITPDQIRDSIYDDKLGIRYFFVQKN